VANVALSAWVDEAARRLRPDRVVWCDGSPAETERLKEQAIREGVFRRLNAKSYPNCLLHRSHPSDVARTEHLTFICTPTKEEAGPTNNWMEPGEARRKVEPLFEGAMKGRTLYVMPYLMGPPGSPFSKVGVEITDSLYVVISMGIMTRMGKVALDQLGDSPDFVKGLHSLGDLSPDRRFILHFPQEKAIWSVGSGYGGNALLGKKCFSLRIASGIGRREGWLAEHMLILGLTSPQGETTYVAAAFPSACGKTNLAMLRPPAAFKGYTITTVGDDIAWLRVGPDGRLWAINPEAGFFGVAPGTGPKTNPAAMETVRANSLFTNVALTPDNEPWWEGMDVPAPSGTLDWRGNAWQPGAEKAAHPNSRFTAPARQCPTISPKWEDPRGVPIDAIIFGGRRTRTVPLVYEARDWAHGVFVGSIMASETTAAATHAVGMTRRDPMAMLPFCGYHMGDYFAHWLALGPKIPRPPRIFNVNWFRKGADDQFLWPGYGENLRVLLWIAGRAKGRGAATETPIGLVPSASALPLDGLRLADGAVDELLAVDPGVWREEAGEIGKHYATFGDRLPAELRAQYDALRKRLG
jgi:phosphoenolpyruvate carboxykinase (GTP)